MVEALGIIGAALALIGTVLNNRRNRACFYCWIAANLFILTVHLVARIWSLAGLDLAFIYLAVDGLRRWRKADAGFTIHTNPTFEG